MNEKYCSSEEQSHEPNNFRNTPFSSERQHLADTQDFSFEEISHRTVEAINSATEARVTDNSVVPTRRTNV